LAASLGYETEAPLQWRLKKSITKGRHKAQGRVSSREVVAKIKIRLALKRKMYICNLGSKLNCATGWIT